MRAQLAALAALLAATPALAEGPRPVGAPSAPGYAPIGKDEQGIWDQAAENERELRASKLVVRDPAVNAYLRSVLCREVGDDRCAAARLYVVRAPFFNAYAMPNGALMFTTGALLRIRNEAELAAVLGHEFGHFEYRHGLSGLKSARSAASWGVWLTVLSIGVGQGANYTNIFAAGHFAHSRDQEREADLAGLRYMAKGGYRTRCASDIWEGQRSEQDATAAALGVKNLKDSFRGPFASHPMDIERQVTLREQAKSIGVANTYDGQIEYRQALLPIWPMLVDDQVKLNDFGGSEFILANLAATGWTGPLLFARGELYRSAGSADRLPLAIGFYRDAIAAKDPPAQAWRGLALALARSGDRAGAKAAAAEYLVRRPDAGDRSILESLGDAT